jgi:hypothetical protein
MTLEAVERESRHVNPWDMRDAIIKSIFPP